jgi:hypothetical protein
MANGKRNRKSRRRREPETARMPSCTAWFLREMAPLIARAKLPRTRSTRHLRNATIEVLEAVRALLDETIEWLRRDKRSASELKRIKVEG